MQDTKGDWTVTDDTWTDCPTQKSSDTKQQLHINHINITLQVQQNGSSNCEGHSGSQWGLLLFHVQLSVSSVVEERGVMGEGSELL